MTNFSIWKHTHFLVNDFLELIYPEVCIVCGEKLLRSEQFICNHCLLQMPCTNFHKHSPTPAEKLFFGRTVIEHALCFFHFTKGSDYQKILHQLKYKGKKELGRYLGKRYGEILLETHFFDHYDFLCPVPLHPRKQKQRGYNQSTYFARGLSEILDIPVLENILIRTSHNPTQTKKNRWERWLNVHEIFQVIDYSQLEKKRIILVDDVLTTGATIEACAQTIHSACSAKISVITIAIA